MDSITKKCGDISKPLIYFKGNLVVLKKSNKSEAYFGGDMPQIFNLPRSAKVHQLFTLKQEILDVFDTILLCSLPLIYPFMHDGGSIKYQINNDGDIEIQSIIPKVAADGWPYKDYPASFRKVNFKREQALKMGFNEFENLLPQGLLPGKEDDIIVAIPPSNDYGVSLWGEHGDAENVLCIFSICPKTGNVYADNQCS